VGAARAAGLDVTIVDASLDEEGLRRAYRAAAWLLAPSLEEGYDLPVAEALASGTPVVGSDISAHRDLLDFGAKGLLLVPPPTAPDAWPAATALLREPPPAEVRPPAGTWADAARSVRDALVAS
jgi:glycosyltransferase involved in cell wall biosynthesis